MSVSNQKQSQIPSSQHNGHSARLSQIQKQLNIKCCQHDSLMPLLQISSYESSLYRWENNLKNINKKISQYEVRVNGLLREQAESSRQGGVGGARQCNQQELSPGQSKNDDITKLRNNIEQMKQKLNLPSYSYSNSQFQIHSQYEQSQAMMVYSLYENNANSNKNTKSSPYSNKNKNIGISQRNCIGSGSGNGNGDISQNVNALYDQVYQQFSKFSQQSLQQLRKYSQLTLAIFKNSLLLSQHQSPISFSTSPQLISFSPRPDAPNYSSQLGQKISKHILSLPQLRKTIQYQYNSLIYSSQLPNQQQSDSGTNKDKSIGLGIMALRNRGQGQQQAQLEEVDHMYAYLQDFHQVTMNRLSCDLVQINQMLDFMFKIPTQHQPYQNQYNPKQTSPKRMKLDIEQQQKQQQQQQQSTITIPIPQQYNINNSINKQKWQYMNVLQQKLMLIQWQIRGLKKKYLKQLNCMYVVFAENQQRSSRNINIYKHKYREKDRKQKQKVNKDSYQIHLLQKKLVADITELSQTHKQIKNKINYLRSKYQMPRN